MLSDQEIEAIARAHVKAEQNAMSRPNNPLRLEPEKNCDVEDPPGIYYSTRVLDPPGDTLFGSGGFFVSRATGVVTVFGSGELIVALGMAGSGNAYSREMMPAVVKILFRQRSPEAVPEEPFDGRWPGNESS